MKESLYLKRYSYQHQLIEVPPNDDLSLCIVIPCYNENTLIDSLKSINECNDISTSVEVIVIINDSIKESEEVLKQNTNTFVEATKWANEHNTYSKRFFIRHISKLGQKEAGVGYARKIGMDEAFRRFNASGNDGFIVCFDADSSCSKNYLEILEQHSTSSTMYGCSINFEHPLNGYDQEIISGIINYELHLRYYINALKSARYPYAHHTIGSSMAVRSSIYEKAGGMNKRKAGEDFYFLHKIIPYGNYKDIYECTIYPSPRVSTRVPFGTGRFMSGWVSGDTDEKSKSYSPKTFEELKVFFKQVPDYHRINNIESLKENLPNAIREFLEQDGFENQLNRIKKDTKTYEAFEKRFFQWFNGLKVLKFVHYSRDFHHPNLPLESCCEWLFSNLFQSEKNSLDKHDWLEEMRIMDKRYSEKSWTE
ncbi:MAG: glycosyltransferase [Bacteroidota bacterium]